MAASKNKWKDEIVLGDRNKITTLYFSVYLNYVPKNKYKLFPFIGCRLDKSPSQCLCLIIYSNTITSSCLLLLLLLAVTEFYFHYRSYYFVKIFIDLSFFCLPQQNIRPMRAETFSIMFFIVSFALRKWLAYYSHSSVTIL